MKLTKHEAIQRLKLKNGPALAKLFGISRFAVHKWDVVPYLRVLELKHRYPRLFKDITPEEHQ